jgi:hypothetical protein
MRQLRAAIDEAIKEAQADLDGRTAVEQIAKEKPKPKDG